MMDRTLAAAAALLVGGALAISHGIYDPAALALVTLGAAAAVASLRAGRIPARAGRLLLCGATVTSLGWHAYTFKAPAYVALAAVAALLAASYLQPQRVAFRFPVLLACFAAMGALTILSLPLPRIDVMMFQHLGGQALLQGRNPYELVFPNLYGHTRFYGPGMLVDGKVVVFPYPPLVAACDAISLFVARDVRWTFLLACVTGAWFVSRLGGEDAELAAAFAVLQPATFYVLGLGWTEPTVFAAWAATLLCFRRRPAVPAGLLLAFKQYTPLLLFPLAVSGMKRRALAVAVVIAAATMLPFAVWNPHEFWRDVAVAQFLQPLRTDALSWLAACARWTGRELPSALGFAAAAAVLAFGLCRDRSLPRAAATAAAAFTAFLLFNKQAFCNYYWLAATLLASAAAAGPEA